MAAMATRQMKHWKQKATPMENESNSHFSNHTKRRGGHVASWSLLAENEVKPAIVIVLMDHPFMDTMKALIDYTGSLELLYLVKVFCKTIGDFSKIPCSLTVFQLRHGVLSLLHAVEECVREEQRSAPLFERLIVVLGKSFRLPNGKWAL